MFFWQKNNKSFFDYFEEQAKEAYAAAKLLGNIFDDLKNSTATAKKIKEIEHVGDTLTRTVIQQMNTVGFILPLDHDDILAFAKTIDDVIDYIDDASKAFTTIYQLNSVLPFARELALLIIQGTEIVASICSLLKHISQNARTILDSCLTIYEIESRAEEIKRAALKELFNQLKSLEIDLPTYLAWNEIYRTLETVTDKIEECANIAEQLVMKYS